MRALGLDRHVPGIGTLAVGAPADVVLLDPDAEWTVEPERFASKGKNTPLAGVTLTGAVVATIAGGRIVHDERGARWLRRCSCWKTAPSFAGDAIGAPVRAHGEVVFCTAMTGYQEALTDPSFAEQMLVMTYPLQGNYGVNEFDVESRRIQVRALRRARGLRRRPATGARSGTLHAYLAENGIPGIAGIDTRALTRKLRTGGVMMGTVTHDETAEQALARLRDLPRYGSTDLVPWVSTRQPYAYPAKTSTAAGRRASSCSTSA